MCKSKRRQQQQEKQLFKRFEHISKKEDYCYYCFSMNLFGIETWETLVCGYFFFLSAFCTNQVIDGTRLYANWYWKATEKCCTPSILLFTFNHIILSECSKSFEKRKKRRRCFLRAL